MTRSTNCFEVVCIVISLIIDSLICMDPQSDKMPARGKCP